MSFTTAGPAARLGSTLLRGASLGAMAQTVGIIVSAGLLAALYHAANEEAKSLLQNIQVRSRVRQARHEAILLYTLGSELNLVLQEHLLQSRDAFRAALMLLTNPHVVDDERRLLRDALYRASQSINS